jgi:hypothetical protein
MTNRGLVPPVVAFLRTDVERSTRGAKRLKLRTLLSKFGYSKRSDSNTAEITRLLSEACLAINPPIVRFGDSWEITLEDWIYLSSREAEEKPANRFLSAPTSTWNADGWFDRITGLELRTEKEVEIKFIVPLLTKLGYTDDDRYDGMPVPAAHGSLDTTLGIDFALFNAELDSLRNQPLLTVEAKRESRLSKQKELSSAHNQAKSYCLWTQCDFFMVTDSRTLHAYQVARGRFGESSPIFACERHELQSRFSELYVVLSKDALTRHYLAKLSATEETG